jgi:hypothetical protein
MPSAMSASRKIEAIPKDNGKVTAGLTVIRPAQWIVRSWGSISALAI